MIYAGAITEDFKTGGTKKMLKNDPFRLISSLLFSSAVLISWRPFGALGQKGGGQRPSPPAPSVRLWIFIS